MTTVAPLGASVPRLEASAKVSGSIRYTDDITLPGMLHGAILGSLHPHARILGYDIAAARSLPGVKAIVTGSDCGNHRFGLMIGDETALAVDKVRYIGEPVAAVAATDRETAITACSLIRVNYDVLPSMLTPEDALADGALPIHEDFSKYTRSFDCLSNGNTMAITHITAGDAVSAWDKCDIVVDDVYETPGQHHAYMEPVAAIADIDAMGRVIVWSSTQSVFRTQICISQGLGLPRSKVRAISPSVGGGFGGKSEPGTQLVAALLARATKRPVKVVLSRTEDIATMRSRHPARIRLRTGALRDGTLLVRSGEVLMDGGAYADDSPAAMMMAIYFLGGPYRIPNISFEGRVVYTNKLRSGAFRGVGNSQAAFACESQIDEIAEKLQIDPIELRIKNAFKEGDCWLGGRTISSASLVECLERVRDESGWSKKRKSLCSSGSEGHRCGLGVSSVVYTCAYSSTSAILRLLDDGSISVATGAVDIGQGSDTAITQMCAAALGLPLEAVQFIQPDTDAVPYNSGTNASRITYMLGHVIAQATDDIKDQLFEHAAALLNSDVSALELQSDGWITLKESNKGVSFAQISRRAHFKEGGPIIGRGSYVYKGGDIEADLADTSGMMSIDQLGNFVFGAQVVEVDVDETTGRVKVVQGWSVHDVGRAVNRQAVEGQIEGGFVMGVGYALQEELITCDGRVVTDSLATYKIPAPADAPTIHPIIIENPEPTHPFGVKGIGEPPLLGVAPAIANAVQHAAGVRVRRLPISGERVLSALLASPGRASTK
jgi:CO/xanthine dehydrogenase Mo-binding subunit